MAKKKRVITRYILIAIPLIAVSLLIVLGYTNALFVNDETSLRTNNYNTGLLSITAVSKTKTISLDNTLPMQDEDGEKQEPYIFTIKNNGNVDYKFDIQLLSINENTFNPQYIKVKVDNDDIMLLSNLTESKIKEGLIIAAGDSMDISLRVWLSYDTPNTEIGKKFDSQLVISGIAVQTASNYKSSAASYIINLYNSANKEEIENNSIKYNYAKSVGLVSDRYGGITIDNNAGNIRYYGENPNNYIYFNCADYSKGNTKEEPNNCELWRIIGVFDNMIKIIRNDSIGRYPWSNNGINTWNTSSLEVTLNLENYWNSLKNAKTKNMIAETTWNVGELNSTLDMGNIYNSERKSTLSWIGKVGLPSASDYMYAGDNSWLTSVNSTWILDLPYQESNNAYAINGNRIERSNIINSNEVFPTLFINSGMSIYSGDGSIESPYMIR